MRNDVSLRNVLLFLLLTSPALVCAQFHKPAFHEPTPEELKMTADPKAPGADAVFLDIEEIANDQGHYQCSYARIKVLTEKGKEMATVSLPYLKTAFKIEEIKGRTIHPDGTVIPLAGTPEDLLVAKKGDLEIGQKVFTLPDVEVGSILEYSYDLSYPEHIYSSPMWEIQKKFFVHQAHYEFTPFKAFLPGMDNEETQAYLMGPNGERLNTLMWWSNLPQGVSVQQIHATGRFTVDVTDVPPIPDEEWMPPVGSFLYKVLFYYKGSSNVTQFWLAEVKRWSKDVDHFAEPSKPIQEAAAGLIAPGDSELDKAKKLYTAVQALDNTDYSRKKSETELKQLKLKEAKRAEDTWKQKSGSSEDLALLYLAMARAAGLTAYALKVVDRDRGIFDVRYLYMGQLDSTLVIVGIDGKEVLVDPGEKMCPFQTVSWKHSSAAGLRQNPDGPGYLTTPAQPYKANSTMRTGDLTLDAHGAITGTVQFVMSGQVALRWRDVALENDETEVKKQFDKELESLVPDGVEAHVDHFLGLDNPDVNLMAVVKVKGSMGTATAKRLMFPGFFFESRGHTPFVNQEKRLDPIDMHFGDIESDQVTYHLPAGLAVEGAPADARISWEGHAACIVKAQTLPNQITIARTLVRAFTEAKPEEYQDLRGFYQKIAASDQQVLVLTAAAPEGKGN
jgi:hypothetical protein